MEAETRTREADARIRKPWYRHLYAWVLAGIALGVVVGYLFPSTGTALEPVGTSFVGLIKMLIAPIVFCTVVVGIASVDSLRKVGRVGLRTLVYFELVTTVALALGIIVMNVFKPGSGVHADPTGIKVSDKVSGYIAAGKSEHWYDFIVHIIPTTVVSAFADGDVLQVLFVAVLFAIAVKGLGQLGEPITAGVERIGQVLFRMLHLVMYAAPVGAFGAMAFTVGKYGIGTLTSLGGLVLTFYATSAFFVLVVLGAIAARSGVNIVKLLRYLKEELLVVLGTSSSESVLPQVMRKLENLGVPRQIVGLTVPSGYSFNLDGTCIYLTLAALFVAQAEGVDLSLGQQLGILAVLLLTSKGAAGVTGSGFIVLAATLSATNLIPVAGIMLIFGIDKFMSECRALTNLCGNSVGTLAVARWEGVLDVERARRVLDGEAPETEAPEPPAAGPEAPADQATALSSA